MAERTGSILENAGVGTESSKPLFSREKTGDSKIRELVIEGRRKLKNYAGIKNTPLPVSEISSSEVKGFLNERIGNLTIEGTIHEMYLTIKGMETQLRKVLNINASLDKDLKVAKEALKKLNNENEELSSRLKGIEEEGPLKTELERELQQLIVEHNRKQEEVQDINKSKDKTIIMSNSLRQEILRLEEEKEDVIKDASFLQSKMEDSVAKLRDIDAMLTELKGENLFLKEKIKQQEEEISTMSEEKNGLRLELKESKDAFDEIYDALIETKVKTKKFFYQELQEK